jgi:hypothetical protein
LREVAVSPTTQSVRDLELGCVSSGARRERELAGNVANGDEPGERVLRCWVFKLADVPLHAPMCAGIEPKAQDDAIEVPRDLSVVSHRATESRAPAERRGSARPAARAAQRDGCVSHATRAFKMAYARPRVARSLGSGQSGGPQRTENRLGGANLNRSPR